MERDSTVLPPSMWRRCAAAIALCCYLFAATFGAISHSQAMALMVPAPGTEVPAAAPHGGHDHAAPHDHTSVAGQAAHEQTPDHGDHAPMPAKTPCEQGCILCQSCSPCGVLATLSHSGDMISFAYAVRYAMPALPLPSGHIGALPPEPPRA